MKRKFYRQIICVDVLSEDQPLEWDSLDDIAYAITGGDCSGVVSEKSCKLLSAKQAAAELQKQGSDPGFFRLTSRGRNLR